MSNYTDLTKPKEEQQNKPSRNAITPVTFDPTNRALLLKQKRKLHRRRKNLETATFIGYLTPSFAGVLLFFFIPLAMLFKTSFQKSSTNTTFNGFSNYESVLTNGAFKEASVNTLTFAALAVPLAVVISLLLALLLNSGMPGRSVFRSILLNPMMVPVASVVLIWQVFFSYNGVANGWGLAHLFGETKIDWLKSDYAQLVILFMFLWKNLGYNMVLFLAALNNIPGEILESAMMDGAGAFKRFFAIKMHYLSPTIFFVAIMSLINSFKIFREVYLLTGDYPNELYMLQHFMNNMFHKLDYAKLSAGAIIMCVAMVIIVGGLFYLEGKFDADVEE